MLKILNKTQIEWPTLALLATCYGLWALATTVVATWWLPAGIALTILTLALHSSLTHEVIHGHPFRNPRLNALLVWPTLGLFVPFGRFRDTHLAHHMDSILTDPYDDPESNYLDAGDWERQPRLLKLLRNANNTLAGRMILGPLIGQIAFMATDLRLARHGDRAVAAAWALHIPQVAIVLSWVLWIGAMPLWAYVLSAYAALSILKIRTFLEHQASERPRARTVVIEDRGPLALIFLNNNLHMVHHMHPKMPWYRLPDLYFENRDKYLTRNEGYFFRSYAEIFRRYFLARKDPVPHPLWRR